MIEIHILNESQNLHIMIPIVEYTISSSCSWSAIAKAWTVHPYLNVIVIIIDETVIIRGGVVVIPEIVPHIAFFEVEKTIRLNLIKTERRDHYRGPTLTAHIQYNWSCLKLARVLKFNCTQANTNILESTINVLFLCIHYCMCLWALLHIFDTHIKSRGLSR